MARRMHSKKNKIIFVPARRARKTKTKESGE